MSISISRIKVNFIDCCWHWLIDGKLIALNKFNVAYACQIFSVIDNIGVIRISPIKFEILILVGVKSSICYY